MSTMTEHAPDLDSLREAFHLAASGNWRDYRAYLDRILDEALEATG